MALKKIIRTDGFFGLYRGYSATLITYAPYSSIWWGTYHFIKQKIKRKIGDFQIPNFFLHSFSGIIAGIAAVTFTNPLDVVKTRLQVLNLSPKERNVFLLLKKLFVEEGFKGAMKGVTARFSSAIIVSCFSIVLYEEIKLRSLKK